MAGILGDIEDENEDDIYIYKVNVNYDRELAEKYKVMSVPTVICFVNGEAKGKTVGLKEQDLLKYPHEFSGGQRQRISIARALSVQPEFVVCDEPISALDVSLQAQIVQMLQDLQEKYGLTYLFISHQLQVVQKICDEIGVLYLGNLMEIADADKLYSNPLHPYTKMLISSIPVPDPRAKTLDQIVADTGVQSRSIGGCRFHNRCPWCEERCRQETPALRQVEPGHMVACHKYQEKK